uniref:glutathione S-transferase n=1 Tax=Ningiella ruwaisensis TaxID=2364274 RepID=UPI00109F181D|nr:glutathione S-transferase [Ningiella ruwaisensis]
MFTLHHLQDSRSQRIVWLFELMGADYDIKAYKRDPKTSLAPESFKKLHPLGSAPLVSFNDETIAESGAICEFVLTKAGKQADAVSAKERLLCLHDEDKHLKVQFWSHYSEGSFLPPLVTAMVLNKARAKAKPFFVKFIANKIIDAIMDAYFDKVIKRNLKFVESHLEGKTFFVGDEPTVADVQMSFGLEALEKSGKLSSFPNMTAYVARLHAMPSYRKAMEKMAAAEASL